MPERKIWKECLPLFILVIMLCGLFVSRALLSVSSVWTGAFFFFHTREKDKWKIVAFGTLLIILPVVISGFSSESKADWLRAIEVKVPLITIGLGIATMKVSLKSWQKVVLILLLLTFLGTLWSTYKFINSSSQILADYLKAKVMPTPLDDDHVRFSWLVVLVSILSLPVLQQRISVFLRGVVICVLFWFIFYLHLLAAKTGLVCLYVSVLMLACYYIISRKKWLLGLASLVAIVVIPVLAYSTLPTFRNRLQYIVYDYNNYSAGNFIPGLSDGARVLSLKAGWDITRQHPLMGVGFGDMKPGVNRWHQQHQATSFEYERFLPLNEWLYYGTGSGIPGIIIFTAGIFALIALLWKTGGIIAKTMSVVLLIPLITDDTLERQFGVVIFIFVLMWLRLHSQLKQEAFA